MGKYIEATAAAQTASAIGSAMIPRAVDLLRVFRYFDPSSKYDGTKQRRSNARSRFRLRSRTGICCTTLEPRVAKKERPRERSAHAPTGLNSPSPIVFVSYATVCVCHVTGLRSGVRGEKPQALAIANPIARTVRTVMTILSILQIA